MKGLRDLILQMKHFIQLLTIQELLSLILFGKTAGVPDPQVQEQHIAAGAVNSYHIPELNINSDALSDGSIDTSDLTTNVTAGIIPADDRTVDDVVFIGRHFEDDALTNDKFDDNCSADRMRISY